MIDAQKKERRSGFLIIFDEQQRTDFLRIGVDISGGFSDALSAHDWKLKQWEVCGLLFEPGVITHWTLARKGKRVATSKTRVEFSQMVSTRISMASIESLLGAQLKPHLVKARSGVGGRVPNETWLGLKKAVRQLDPESFAALERLEALRDQSHEYITSPGYQIVAEQRDAVGIALDAFDATGDLRKETLKGWAAPGQLPLTSFLDGLAGIRTIEDQLIARDAAVFPGTKAVRHTVLGAVFGLGEHKLEVFNINRTSTENALGVDLLYWNEYFDAWTLIQYKMMERKRSGSREDTVYRPDPGFDEALQQMGSFREKSPDTWARPHQAMQYRLCGDGFYFKLCSRIRLEVLSDSLLPGMYFPRQFISAALMDSQMQGPRGGRLITFENPGRHINNTVFTHLLRDGWIGTRGISSSAIAKIMHESLAADNAIVIARARPRGAVPNLYETIDRLDLPATP